MAKSTNKEEGKKDNQAIYVDIKGAVRHPNVYKMNSSDRMIDILNKAQLLKMPILSNSIFQKTYRSKVNIRT